MNPSQNLQPAYVLHSRNYRETSLLVDFFCANHGRVSAVAKRVRGSKNKLSLFRPFQPVQITWTGRTDLKSLSHIEITQSFQNFPSLNVYCGYYLNELLLKLIGSGDAYIELFSVYMECLEFLKTNTDQKEQEKILRKFEFLLLRELGYGLNLSVCSSTGKAISSANHYYFLTNVGFIEEQAHMNAMDSTIDSTMDVARAPTSSKVNPLFPGSHLLAIAEGNYNNRDALKSAKIITRRMIDFLLNGKPLNSRVLYAQMIKKMIETKMGGDKTSETEMNKMKGISE